MTVLGLGLALLVGLSLGLFILYQNRLVFLPA